MKPLTILVSAILLIVILTVTDSISQNSDNSFETKTELSNSTGQNSVHLQNLEIRHKAAVQNGRVSEVLQIEEEMSMLTPDEMELRQVSNTPGMTEVSEPPQGDWHSADKVVHFGLVKPSADSGKTMDMKIGEDGVMYSVVNSLPDGTFYKGNISLYKSTDKGANWTHIFGYLYTSYVGSVSMLIESKDNSNTDSTRLIVFYTLSSNANMSDATVNYISIRSNATAANNGVLATPPAGKKYSHVSALSDGAYYAAPTYYGVVFTECNNTSGFTSVTKTRYFRTVNWGASWLNTTLTTGFADYFPSADYKEGASDSVYIAVERRTSSSRVDIVLLKTPAVPTAAYNQIIIREITNVYRKPNLTIMQTNPAMKMVITYSGNSNLFYSDSEDGTNGWEYSTYLQNSGNNYSVFTHCTSSPSGEFPFVAVCMTADGDSVNVIKIPTLHNVIFNHKVNSLNASQRTPPVIAIRPGIQNNLVNIMYAGTSVTQDSLKNAISDYEGNKTLSLKLSLQGFYNSNTNKLNAKDTVRIYLRRWYETAVNFDSGKAVLDSVSMTLNFNFQDLQDSYYYAVIRHRNSLETWTKPFYIRESSQSYDLTTALNKAYGDNQIQVDNTPVMFSIYGGDVDQDGSIDATDLSMIDNDSYIFAAGYKKTDVNGDRFVDASDAAVTDNNATNFVAAIRP
jgi:hypothetical protein